MRCLNVVKKGDGRGKKNNCRHSAKASSDSVICFAGCGIMIAIDAPVR